MPTLTRTPAPDLRPPLKWAGGKRWLVPHLETVWAPHRHRRLVEPLCGGLAVTLGLCPKKALLNDINPHSIGFFRWLQKGLVIELPQCNEETAYYAARTRFNALITAGEADSREAASLFYYLNRTGFNGLCRFNRSGQYNVPFGSYKTINYVYDFTQYRSLLSKWTFSLGDFSEMRLKPDDFVYADPPYDVEFTQYSKETFLWDDQVRLARWLAAHPGPVALSNQATPRIVDLYESLGFDVRKIEAPRMISCNGDRTPAMEVLATRGV